MSPTGLARRVEAVAAAVAAAARGAGRRPADVAWVAVSKRQPVAALEAAYAAGVRDFGENQAQDLAAKAAALAARGWHPRWHMLGRVQSNKAASVGRHAYALHSLDRADLVARLIPPAGRRLRVYIQVNLGDEAHKGGVAPAALPALAQAVVAAPHLQLEGLMVLPPQGEDPAPHFAALARLGAELRRSPATAAATGLSMGMSADFVPAIAAGATVVRIGTAVFGARPHP